MAEVINYQEIYSKLGEMQSKLDDLFLQAVENSEFRSASVIIRFNIRLQRNEERADILSEEYKNSAFAKNMVALSRSLIQSGPVESGSLQIQFIWSDAFYLLGSASLSPISESNLSNIYVQSVIRKRYSSSIQEMFRNSDRSSGFPIPGNIRIVLQIEKDGKVSQVNVVEGSLRGSLIEKSVQDLVKNWSFPGIKSSLRVSMSLIRSGSGGSSMSASSSSSQIWVPNFGWISLQDWMNYSQAQSFSPNPWVSVFSPTLPLPPPRDFSIFYATPSIPIPPPYSIPISYPSPEYGVVFPPEIQAQSSSANSGINNPALLSQRLPFLPISEISGNLRGGAVPRSSQEAFLSYMPSRYTLDYGVVDYGVVDYGVLLPD